MIKVIIEKKLDDSWASDEDFVGMTDEEIVELCQEDMVEFIDSAVWTVRR